jgi:hypothetical protein
MERSHIILSLCFTSPYTLLLGTLWLISELSEASVELTVFQASPPTQLADALARVLEPLASERPDLNGA